MYKLTTILALLCILTWQCDTTGSKVKKASEDLYPKVDSLIAIHKALASSYEGLWEEHRSFITTYESLDNPPENLLSMWADHRVFLVGQKKLLKKQKRMLDVHAGTKNRSGDGSLTKEQLQTRREILVQEIPQITEQLEKIRKMQNRIQGEQVLLSKGLQGEALEEKPAE